MDTAFLIWLSATRNPEKSKKLVQPTKKSLVACQPTESYLADLHLSFICMEILMMPLINIITS